MSANPYAGPAGKMLAMAEARTAELDSLHKIYESCRWWQWRRRRAIRRMAAWVIATAGEMLAESARLDGDDL